MEMKRKKISVTSLILPVIMLVVAVILPMIYSTNYYIQLFSQTLIIPCLWTLSSKIGTLAAETFPHFCKLHGNFSIG